MGYDSKGSFTLLIIFYSLYLVLQELTLFEVFCLPSARAMGRNCYSTAASVKMKRLPIPVGSLG